MASIVVKHAYEKDSVGQAQLTYALLMRHLEIYIFGWLRGSVLLLAANVEPILFLSWDLACSLAGTSG